MANILKMITGERYVNNTLQDVYFLGTWQTDGWIYFNDDHFWRYEPTNGILQIFYINKEIWVNTNSMTIKEVKNFNVTMAQNNIHGGGAVAENASVEAAVQWAIDKVTNNWITYDEYPRQTTVGDFNALQYDCSSFIITAFLYAGFPVTGATYTGDMRQYFEPAGFTWYPGTTWYSEDLLRGDILLQEQYHTEMYIGNNQDVNCGTTPGAVVSHWDYYTNSEIGYYNGWDGILRYEP